MNKWALITGASTGLGREFAKLFAADGWNVALTARDKARLDSLAAELQSQYRVSTQVLPADLAVPGAPGEIFDRLRATPISALVNNAGFGQQGAFARLSSHAATIQVNVTALVELTHLFLTPMVERREGRILNVASVATFQPGPFLTIYYASKAFVYSFSCGLA
jgi:short-subunit dehydrogenase